MTAENTLPDGALGSTTEVPPTVDERIRRWNVFAPWLQQDPVTHFTRMREAGPITWSDELGGYWILTRYADVEWAARHPEIFSSAEPVIPYRSMFDTKQIPIERDGEDHRLWRIALSEVFGPEVVNYATPQIHRAAAEAIEPIVRKGRCEFVSEFAVRLPAETFLIIFGIDRQHLPSLLDHKNWLHQNWMTATSSDEIRAANEPLWRFFNAELDRRRAEGPEGRMDVLSHLLTTRYDGRPLTRDEIVNVTFMTMMASLDSTTATLGMAFLHLAEHPEIQDLVVASPERIPAVVEELVRHEPVVTTARLVTRDVERHGITLRAGDRVLMPWGMSGLDPDAFARPDEVDFDRENTRHLAFGIGPHRCLGMGVARRIIQVALQEWHQRIPRYHQDPDTPMTRHYSTVRGLDSLGLILG